MKDRPAVAGRLHPTGDLWPWRAARKDGVLYIAFLDPHGDGAWSLVPIDEREIINL